MPQARVWLIGRRALPNSMVPAARRKSNGDRASIGPVSDQPAARLANAFSARPLSRGGDVLVLVNGDVDVMEGIGQFAGQGRGPREVRVQDEGNVLAGRVPVLRCLRASPTTVQLVVGIRFPLARKRLPWSQLM